VAATLAADQLAKAAAARWLIPGEAIDLLPILELRLAHNTGIAFSMFAGSGAPLVLLTLLVTAVVVGFWVTTRDGGALADLGYALILGGALGNLVDRLRLGYVVDFLHLHLGERTLFVFNLADAALSLGPAALIAAYLFAERPKP
jgi:signal peptidase II